MIDVHAPEGLWAATADPNLIAGLTQAVLRAEGVTAPGAFHLDNTAAFVHRLPATSVGTASSPTADVVRVQVITPPGSLDRDGQRQLTSEATALIAAAAGKPVHTWVILTEATEGGWGIAGTAFGVPEFAALAKAAAAAQGSPS
jgi:phenylpyruvate tautomerase PptA (4-oxalocrotonate tautomerase family)